MRGLKRSPWLHGLGVLLAILVVSGGHARADVTTDQSGSIVVFPKVISDGTRDTLVQLTNRSNMQAQVHCFYINTMGACSVTSTTSCRIDTDCPGTEQCIRACQEQDFDLLLTAQQPTIWRASTGRLQTLLGPTCSIGGPPCSCFPTPSGTQACPGTAPGTGGEGSNAVKPVGTAFLGELKCVQVDPSFDIPSGQNSLLGEAVIETLPTGQISEYNALTISALAGLNGDDDLNLNNGEYNACPNNLRLNHFAEGATEAFSDATVSTELALVPCTELLEQLAAATPGTSAAPRSTGHMIITNEMEQTFSADVDVDCGFYGRLFEIDSPSNPSVSNFSVGVLGFQYATTTITPPGGSICYTGTARCHLCAPLDADPQCASAAVGQQVGNCNCNAAATNPCPGALTSSGGQLLGCLPRSGLLGVGEEFYTLTGRPDGSAAFNLFNEGSRANVGDIITVPTTVIPPIVP